MRHARRCFGDALTARDKRHFLRLQQAYEEGSIARSDLLVLLQSWVQRFGEEYLAGQAYVSPYPRELMVDGGGGGDR
jgi:uncharacterized protein YbgA (DUF1722 family)